MKFASLYLTRLQHFASKPTILKKLQKVMVTTFPTNSTQSFDCVAKKSCGHIILADPVVDSQSEGKSKQPKKMKEELAKKSEGNFLAFFDCLPTGSLRICS